MAERRSGESVLVDSKSTGISAEPRLQGAIFRIWDGRRWVETASSDFDARSLSGAVDSLVEAAARSPAHAPRPGRIVDQPR